MKLQKSDLYKYLIEDLFSVKREKKAKKAFGLEIEMFPFFVLEKSGHQSLERSSLERSKQALEPYFEKNGWLKTEATSSVYRKDQAQFSFEPGGQIEYSSSPRESLADLNQEILSIQKDLKDVLASHSIVLFQTGHDPKTPIENLRVFLKEDRYEIMASHFESIDNSLGKSMMLQTSAIQVCLDLDHDPEIRRKQYLLSQAISPFACALFSNSPYKNEERISFDSYRSQIWLMTDKTRTGLTLPKGKKISEITEEDYIQAYLEFSLGAKLLFYKQKSSILKAPKGFTFQKWMDDSTKEAPTIEDFKKALSTLFPEVRPKGFLEIRSVDAQDFPFQMVPLVFYTGLLYSEKSLCEAFDLLGTSYEEILEDRKRSAYGLSSTRFQSIAKKLMELALRGFDEKASSFDGEILLEEAHKFYELYTKNGKTPASEYEAYFDKAFKAPFLNLK